MMIDTLATAIYEVVPLQYRTFCSFTAAISQSVLDHFSIPSRLLACQMWYCTSDRNYVVGFVGAKPIQDKWDGHVVCCTEGYFIDAATFHFSREFGLDVPSVVTGETFKLPAQIISRANLSNGSSLWWFHPPSGADQDIPMPPPEPVREYSRKLIERLEQFSASESQNEAKNLQCLIME